jgi:hypothetical protein
MLLADVHSAPMYRAVVPLTNIDAFYAASDVEPATSCIARDHPKRSSAAPSASVPGTCLNNEFGTLNAGCFLP